MTINTMIDLETMGVAAGCPICTVGIVEFDPFKPIETWLFGYYKLDWVSWGVPDSSTVEWWLGQSCEARSELDGTASYKEVLGKVMPRLYSSKVIWACDPDFDLAILNAAAVAHGLSPTRYWRARSVRTMKDIGRMINLPEIPREGTYHKASDDAKYQAILVANVMRKLKQNVLL